MVGNDDKYKDWYGKELLVASVLRKLKRNYMLQSQNSMYIVTTPKGKHSTGSQELRSTIDATPKQRVTKNKSLGFRRVVDNDVDGNSSSDSSDDEIQAPQRPTGKVLHYTYMQL